jgi:hypothetical protein
MESSVFFENRTHNLYKCLWTLYGQWARLRRPEECTLKTLLYILLETLQKYADGNKYTHAFVASPVITAAIASIAGRLDFSR